MHSIRTAVALLVIVVLSGCASTGPKFAESAAGPALASNMARIYLYRTALHGAAVQPEVKVNGVVVGRATPNGYFFVDQKPGAYEVTTTTEVERKLSLTLEPGQTRYVKLNISMGFFVGHVYPELIDPDTARREMQDLRYTGEKS